MKFFVLQQDKQVVEIDHYLRKQNIEPEFIRFIRREVMGEVIPDGNGKSDYLAIANKLGFNWEPQADIGHVQYDYRANLMRRLVMEYSRQLVHNIGLPVYEVHGANMFSMAHPVVSAYASLYGDRLYQFRSGKHDVVMSYDASYPQFNAAARLSISHKHLPFAHFSLSDCYRHEQSGEMMLLLRQRRFYMPDLHPYFKDVAEAFAWLPALQRQIVDAGHDAGRRYRVVVEIPSKQVWAQYRHHIEHLPSQLGADVLVNVLEDNNDRYWIINVDYKIIDQLGQSREIGCIQIDVGNAPRLGIAYSAPDGKRYNPVIVHSAIPGGIERYLYMVLDNYHKNGLPFWLCPVQVRLLPVGGQHVQACQDLARKAAALPLRIDVDDRNVGLSAKVRAVHSELIPHYIVVGSQELDDPEAILQQLRGLAKQSDGKPFIPREWPAELSRRLL